MMRTIKSQIKLWKLAVLMTVLPLIFFFVACQDQIEDDIVEITKNSSHALIVPEFIQQRFATLKEEHPDKNYAVVQLNETATEKMQELQSLYGLPKSMEIFKASDGKVVETSNIKSMETFRSSDGKLVVTKKIPDVLLETGGDVQTFAIIEFNAEVSRAADAAAAQDKIYTVVQEQPEFRGGYDSMMTFIRSNLRYPLSARQQGLEGTVYVSFIVEKDGSVDSVYVIRGISPDADREAVRVIQLSPNWIPGRHNRQIVRVRFVLPIKFQLQAQ